MYGDRSVWKDVPNKHCLFACVCTDEIWQELTVTNIARCKERREAREKIEKAEGEELFQRIIREKYALRHTLMEKSPGGSGKRELEQALPVLRRSARLQKK